VCHWRKDFALIFEACIVHSQKFWVGHSYANERVLISKYWEIDKRETVKHRFRELLNKAHLMPRQYYERDEDWMVTCPECHGVGTIGTGDSRIRCSKCGGSGRIKT